MRPLFFIESKLPQIFHSFGVQTKRAPPSCYTVRVRLNTKTVLAIIISVLAVCIVYLTYNKFGWKKYSNDFLGYSIKYPSDWEMHTPVPNNTYDDGTKVDLKNASSMSIYPERGLYGIVIQERVPMYPNKSFEENAEEWMKYYRGSNAAFDNCQVISNTKEDTQLDGKKAVKYTFTFITQNEETVETVIYLYVELAEHKLLLIKYSFGENDSAAIPLYDRVISGVRFN